MGDGRWALVCEGGGSAEGRGHLQLSSGSVSPLAVQWPSSAPTFRGFMIASFLSCACPCRMGVRVQPPTARLPQFGRSTYSSGPYKSPAGSIYLATSVTPQVSPGAVCWLRHLLHQVHDEGKALLVSVHPRRGCCTLDIHVWPANGKDVMIHGFCRMWHVL